MTETASTPTPPDPLATLPPGLAQRLPQALPPGTVEALALRGQAAGLQGQASALLAQADRLEHVARRQAELDQLTDALAAADREVPPLVDAVAAVKAAEREAADRVDEAAENARRAAEAEELARLDGAPPDEQTDALLRVDAARRVERRERAAAEGVTARRLSAEAVLDQARDIVRRVRAAVRDASARVEAATTEDVPPSAWTLMLDLTRVLAGNPPLDEAGTGIAHLLIREYAIALGVDRSFTRAGKRAAEAELKEKWDRLHALPPQDHVLPPGVVPGGVAR